MAAYKTGRWRTITYAGDFSADNRWYWGGAVTPPLKGARSGKSQFSLGLFFGPVITFAAAIGRQTGRVVTVDTGFGASNSDDTSATVGLPPPVTRDETFTGRWSITFTVEEYAERNALDPTLVTTVDGVDFPSFGGVATADGVPASSDGLFEMLKVGTDITVECDGVSASYTVTTPSPVTYDLIWWEQVGTVYSHATTTITEDTYGLSIPTTYTDSDTYHDYSAAGGTWTVYAYQPDSDALAGRQTELNGTVGPENPLSFQCQLRTMENSYPGSQVAQWLAGTTDGSTPHVIPVTCNPNGSASFTQRYWGVTASLESTPQTSAGENTRGPIRAWLDGTTLTSTGEDTRDWRLEMRTWRWQAFTALSHDATTTIKGAHSFTTSESFTPLVKNWELYRYLIFTSDQHGVLTPPPKNGTAKTYAWTVATPGVPETVTIDLRAPGNMPAGPFMDQRRSRYPLKDPFGGTPDDTPDETLGDATRGWMWGVFWAESVGITTGSGVTMNVGDMKLTRIATADVTFLSDFASFLPAWTSSTDNTFHKPFVRLLVDHRLTDLPDMWRVVPFSGSPYLQFASISTVASSYLAIPGLHVTQAVSFPDTFHTNSLYAYFLGGAGATFDHAISGGWTYWYRKSLTSSLPVYAQELTDEITLYPGCGNCFDPGGLYTDPTNIAICKYIRALAIGVTMDTTPKARAATVTTKEHSGGASTGSSSGTSNYITGTPWARGNRSIDTECLSLTDTHTWSSRRWEPTSFGGLTPLSERRVSVDQHASSFVRAFTSDDAVTGWADATLVWQDTVQGFSATDVAVAVAKAGPPTITLVYVDGGSVLMREALGVAGTFGASTTLGTGERVAIIASKNTTRYIYWLDGTDIKGEIKDVEGTSIVSTFTAVAGVDADSDLDITEATDASGAWKIVLQCYVSGSIVTKTSVDGVTFV